MTTALAVLVVGVGTYLCRSLFILALAKRRIPDAVLVALRYVGPAVLASLIVALLITDDGTVAIGIPELAAFVVGGATAYKTRNHIYTLVAGMAVLWLVGALV